MEVRSRLVPGTICIAAVSNQETPGPAGSAIESGDVLTVQEHNIKTGECLVLTVDGSTTTVPANDLLHRQPIALEPMPWFHGFIDRAEAQARLDLSCIGQFLLRMSRNSPGIYAVAVCTELGFKHFLIAINKKTNRVSLDGDQFFTDLPTLIKFHLDEAPHRERPELPPLVEPVPVQGQLRYYIDQQLLEKVWGLPHDGVEVLKSLGKGEFGEVHAGTYKGLQVAVKSIPDELEDPSAIWSFLQEAAVMTHLRHKNLVQLVGIVFHNSTPKEIVIELIAKGSLIKYLVSRGRSVVSHAELIGYARDVCEGMVYMSSMGFVHRDLAARNILLSSSGVAKISDFGLARKMDVYSPREGGKFPIKWTAPEALLESRFSEKSDVWSFAIFLWELYSFGRTPYPTILVENVLDQLQGGYTMDPPDSCPEEVYDIMCNCWKMDPASRPCFVDLKQLLSKSFGESRTPCSSPLPTRRALAKFKAEIDTVVGSPKASEVYRSAPLTSYADMFLSNLVFIGAEESGKTSLIRSFRGERFRSKEPSTITLELPASYSELVSHRNWTTSELGGLAYEHQLIRCIAGELLVDLQAVLNPKQQHNAPPLPPPLPMRRRPISVCESSEQLPPLPARPAVRSRMSVNFDELHSIPNGLDLTHSESPTTTSKRFPKLKIGKLFSKKALKKRRSGSIDFDMAVAAPSHTRSSSLPFVEDASTSINSTTVSCSAPTASFLTKQDSFVSAIPELLATKIKEKLNDIVAGSLPNEYFAKLIDSSSHVPISLLSPLLLTEATLVIAVVDLSLVHHSDTDASKDTASSPEGLPQINQLVDKVNAVCHKWLSSPRMSTNHNGVQTRAPPRVILVGTHIDRIGGLDAKRNYEEARKALKSSPCGKFLSSAAFMVDSLSAIERFGNDDLKKFVIDCMKKGCKQSVPLRWLRCVRRFKSLSLDGQFFITLKEAEGVVKELCQGCNKEEISQIIEFLHKNLVIYDLGQLHPQLSGRVVTDLGWLVWQISNLFSLQHDAGFSQVPQELSSDLEILHSQGVLSEKLMDHIWPFSRQTKHELLFLAQRLELLFLQGANSVPLDSSWCQPGSPYIKKKPSTSFAPLFPAITSIVIPSLVQLPLPLDHYCREGLLLAEPIYLRPKNTSGSSIFPRLIIRCLQNYSRNSVLFRKIAFFSLSQTTMLKLEDCGHTIKVTLHSISENSSPLSMSSSSIATLSSLSDNTAEVAMTALMFLKATTADLLSFWMPYVTYDFCVHCKCSKPSDSTHFMVLPDSETVLSEKIVCELEHTVSLPPSVAPWLGEDTPTIKKEMNEEEDIEEEKSEQQPEPAGTFKIEEVKTDDEEENYEATADIDMHIDRSLEESWAMLTSIKHTDPSSQLQFENSDKSTSDMLQEWCDLALDNPLNDIISALERTASKSSS